MKKLVSCKSKKPTTLSLQQFFLETYRELHYTPEH